MIRTISDNVITPLKLNSIWFILIVIYIGLFLFEHSEFVPTLQFAAVSLLQTSPFILFAAALVGWLKATGAETIIAGVFKGQGYFMILVAALIGGIAPFCSCEVIPFVAALLGAGVPISAVMAFWLSSPLMDPVALTITAGALGWKFAIAKTIAAIAVGIFGGIVIKIIADIMPNVLDNPLKERHYSRCGCDTAIQSGHPVWKFWISRDRLLVFRDEMAGNGLFLLKWLFFAYTIEALMIRFMPAELVATLVGGDGIWPIIIASVLGAPAYLNGYAAPAIVGGFMQQGMSAGAAMSFLIAGGVTSIPAMTAVFALVRIRVFALYIVLGFVGAIFSGLAFSAA